jgi:predicted RNase H-like HicB family nuclease
MSLRYQIVLHKSEEGYAVNCPALPGCWSQGETEQEAMQNIRDAIEDYLAAVSDAGDLCEGRTEKVTRSPH